LAKKIKRVSRKSKSNSLSSLGVHQIAHYLFLAGIIIAIVVGIVEGAGFSINPTALLTTLVLLGFVVGLINLSAKETMPFLLASIALLLAGIVRMDLIYWAGKFLAPMLRNIVVFVVPGAIIVSIKTIWRLASD
jgi:F0F1-type ATP synthase assembly protein I